MASFGQIFQARMYFKGTRGPYRNRPVLVIDDSEPGLVTIVEITTSEPNDPPTYHDRFKVAFIDWDTSGLDEESWAKCGKTNIHKVELVD